MPVFLPWKISLSGCFWQYLLLLLLLFSCSVVSNSLRPHGLQARLPCPSLLTGVCSHSCLLSQWCHPTISSSVTPFSCPQSFLASGFFPMYWLFASRNQSTGASTSTSGYWEGKGPRGSGSSPSGDSQSNKWSSLAHRTEQRVCVPKSQGPQPWPAVHPTPWMPITLRPTSS